VKEDGMGVIEKGMSHNSDNATAQVLQRVSAEPAYRVVLYKILTFCKSPRSYPEIWQELTSYSEMKAALHPPQALLSWLVQAGGIEQVAEEGQEPKWLTTPTGRNVVQIENPGNRLGELLAQDPVYGDIFLQVLQSCMTPMSRAEIEAMLIGNAILENSKVSASYFIEALERVGGLEWDAKWRTTEAGKAFVK
jgi:hypothetical protein